MLADSIANDSARAEGGQETAGSSRSTIILKPVPMVRLAHHERNFPFNRVVESILSAVREPHGLEEDRREPCQRAVPGIDNLLIAPLADRRLHFFPTLQRNA
jgi:hypothetical protein